MDLISGGGTDTQSSTTAASTATSSATEASTVTSSATEAVSTPTTNETETQSTDAQLTTYTNEEYGYRIQYPTSWSIEESIPNEITFISNAGNSLLRVSILDTRGQQYTLSQIVDRARSGTRSRMTSVEMLKERDVTLSSGQPAHILEFRYDNPNDTAGVVRSTYLVTLHEGIVYEVEFGHLSTSYPETISNLATTIIDSFALTGQRSIDQPTPGETTDGSSNGPLDLSPLTTYTNDSQGYRIRYPTHWTIYDSSPSDVQIANPDSDVIRIVELDAPGGSYTLSELTDQFVQNSKLAMNRVKMTNRRKTTLPNGQSALILHGTYDSPNDRVGLLRTSVLFTMQQDTVYKVGFVADASDWTPTVKPTVTDILTSFTYSSGTSV